MKKILKAFSLLIATLAGIGVVFLLLFAIFFKINDPRDDISVLVGYLTDRELEITGDFSIKMYPSLAVEAGRITLSNTGEYGTGSFLNINHSTVTINLLQLIRSGTISVDIMLEDFEGFFDLGPSGRTNWDDFVSSHTSITGNVRGNIALQGSGQTFSDVIADFDGLVSLELSDGVWHGIDMWHEFRKARASYKREPLPEINNYRYTEIDSMRLEGLVNDGVLTSNYFILESALFNVSGSGEVDLVDYDIDYSVTAKLKSLLLIENDLSVEEKNDFVNEQFPVRIKGFINSPSFRPDIEEIFRLEVEKTIQRRTQFLEKNIQKRSFNNLTPPQ